MSFYKSKKKILIYFVFSLTIFIGLLLDEDTGGSGGYIGDFYTTLPLIADPLDFFKLNIEIKFPLHYFLSSVIFKISNSDIFIFRFLFCFISLLIPILFYLCLKEKYPKFKENIFFLSLFFFFLPHYRSAAIWPNTQISGIFFFLLSILFFLKWNKKKIFFFDKNLLLSIIFIALAVYCRQIYALIYLFYIFFLFEKLNQKNFFILLTLTTFFSLPGIYFIYLSPQIGKITFTKDIYNVPVVTSSIISFYLIPFFFLNQIFRISKINFFENINLLVGLILLTSILSFFFDYNYNMGGGFFLKLSIILFKNLIFFFLTSLIGFYLLFILCDNKKKNFLLSILLIFGVPANIIFQKYYEPMFLILLFIFFENKIIYDFIKNKKIVLLYGLYLLIYLAASVINNIFLLSKNLSI